MLRHLVQNHEVTLVSFVRPDDTSESIRHLNSVCQAVHPVPMRRSLWRNLRAGVKGLLTGVPIVVARDEIGAMTDTLRQLTHQTAFDVIHADQLSMASYGQLAAHMTEPHRVSTLLDEHNAIYMLAQRMVDEAPSAFQKLITMREAKAFTRYEAAMCQAYDSVLTVTHQDREHLLALYPPEERTRLADKFRVVPICIDPNQVLPVAHRNEGVPTVLHMGTMFWPPNIAGVLWFARKVLPLIHEQLPETRFVAVGKNPPQEVQALAADPRIEITGYVLDPTRYLAAADAFLVPLHAGGGMRVKILDAWLWGLPIVSTSIGAEGIETRDGENILIANDASSFAQATLRLLTDSALNKGLRANGRAWVEDNYAWRKVYRRVDKVYSQLLGADNNPG
jgi:glycosyltransferase involved in cell wall biosynthesis